MSKPLAPLMVVWKNMKCRVRGQHRDGSGIARWAGIEIAWTRYADFSVWAWANGYEPGLSPDRKDSEKGYVSGNIQWITKKANAEKARNAHSETCRCFWCVAKRRAIAKQQCSGYHSQITSTTEPPCASPHCQ